MTFRGFASPESRCPFLTRTPVWGGGCECYTLLKQFKQSCTNCCLCSQSRYRRCYQKHLLLATLFTRTEVIKFPYIVIKVAHTKHEHYILCEVAEMHTVSCFTLKIRIKILVSVLINFNLPFLLKNPDSAGRKTSPREYRG